MNRLKPLYCRSCDAKTQHYRSLKYDFGYSCNVCGTWQHQIALTEMQQSYAAKVIIDAHYTLEMQWADGSLEEFIQAACALSLEYEYHPTGNGWDFTAWHPENDERVARIKLLITPSVTYIQKNQIFSLFAFGTVISEANG